MIVHAVYTNPLDAAIVAQLRADYFNHICRMLSADFIMLNSDATYFKDAHMAHKFYVHFVTHRSIEARKDTITVNNL